MERRKKMSLLKKGTCSGCEKEGIYIVNRKHNMCQKCNSVRLNGTDAIHKKMERQKESLSKVKGGSKIRQKSSKQLTKDKSYHNVKMGLIEEAIADGTYYCRGCGNTHSLSLSHLIRRSRRGDLVDVKENMTFHCLVRGDGSQGCHDRWESISEMTDLKDFDENMSIVLRLDPELYWILVHKLRGLGFKINVNEHKNK